MASIVKNGKPKDKIELLAPAKNKESAIASINCGADAVYIGGLRFGARVNASNTIEDIEEVIDYAHLYRAKVYVTINTLLKDSEIDGAAKLIWQLYEIGANAVIIQDMGLLTCDLPPIALHASTQCHNNNLKKVKFLQDVGFERAILARELSLGQIKEIKNNTDIELEAFIHGALCVSYSGQCYMSYAIGGRSGNRGECAQPCRKKYTLVDSNDKIIAKDWHLMSLKDFNLSNKLEDMINAGITSFKIEGRLKDINYVKNVVGYYRKALDEIIDSGDYKKASSGKVILGFDPDLNKTFNRGYSEYFIAGRKNNIAEFRTPKSLGEPLGKVMKLNKNGFILKTDKKLNNGDGICFFDALNNLMGTQINTVEADFMIPQNMKGISQNTFIYRNYNHEFNKELEKANTKRNIDVSFQIFQKGTGIVFYAIDEDGITASAELNSYEKANNEQKALENIEKQLKKLGDSYFSCVSAELEIKEVPFIALSELNNIRRLLVSELERRRVEAYRPVDAIRDQAYVEYPQKELSFNLNVLNKKSKAFYESFGATLIEEAAESGIDMNGKTVMTTKHCLRHSFGMCLKQQAQGAFPSEGRAKKIDETLYLIDEKGKKYKLEFDCATCEMRVIY